MLPGAGGDMGRELMIRFTQPVPEYEKHEFDDLAEINTDVAPNYGARSEFELIGNEQHRVYQGPMGLVKSNVPFQTAVSILQKKN